MAQERNTRFWVWENDGWIKITLRPDQTLKWYTRGQHEEGWSSHGCEWHLCDPHVYIFAWSDDVDCDGRLSTQTELTCLVSDLRYHANEPECPDWERVSDRQRDYAAEAMGY